MYVRCWERLIATVYSLERWSSGTILFRVKENPGWQLCIEFFWTFWRLELSALWLLVSATWHCCCLCRLSWYEWKEKKNCALLSTCALILLHLDVFTSWGLFTDLASVKFCWVFTALLFSFFSCKAPFCFNDAFVQFKIYIFLTLHTYSLLVYLLCNASVAAEKDIF